MKHDNILIKTNNMTGYLVHEKSCWCMASIDFSNGLEAKNLIPVHPDYIHYFIELDSTAIGFQRIRPEYQGEIEYTLEELEAIGTKYIPSHYKTNPIRENVYTVAIPKPKK